MTVGVCFLCVYWTYNMSGVYYFWMIDALISKSIVLWFLIRQGVS